MRMNKIKGVVWIYGIGEIIHCTSVIYIVADGLFCMYKPYCKGFPGVLQDRESKLIDVRLQELPESKQVQCPAETDCL